MQDSSCGCGRAATPPGAPTSPSPDLTHHTGNSFSSARLLLLLLIPGSKKRPDDWPGGWEAWPEAQLSSGFPITKSQPWFPLYKFRGLRAGNLEHVFITVNSFPGKCYVGRASVAAVPSGCPGGRGAFQPLPYLLALWHPEAHQSTF